MDLPEVKRPDLGRVVFSTTPPTLLPELGWKDDALKQQIKVRVWGDVYDAYKMIMNPYWLVNPTAGEIKNVLHHTGVRVQPLHDKKAISRAYYKMLEILVADPQILSRTGPKELAMVAEAPGGFIQAIAEYANLQPTDKAVGMSFRDDKPGVPKFDVAALPKMFKEFHGATGTGDVCRVENVESFAREFPNGANLVTGDGGFEVHDWRAKESRTNHLLLSTLIVAYSVLKPGGSFVCKLYSIYTKPTAQILALVRSCFARSWIGKPPTSRISNTENYIIGTGFLGRDESFKKKLWSLMEQMTKDDPICGADEKSPVISELEGVTLSHEFVTALKTYNTNTEAIKEDMAQKTYEVISNVQHSRDRKEKVAEIIEKNKPYAQELIEVIFNRPIATSGK